MTDGAKTALLVGAVGLGAFFVVRMFAGASPARPSTTQANPLQAQQGAMFLGGLVTGSLQSLYKAGAFSSTTPVTPFVAQPTVTGSVTTSSGATTSFGTLVPGGEITPLPTPDDPYLSDYLY
jgi:hypothetical protein